MSFPLKQKFPEDFKSQMIEHLVSGIVYVQDEVHSTDPANKTYTEDDPDTNTYFLRCGLPDNLIGALVNVARIYGTLNDSFYEFVVNTDYTYNNSLNKLVFTNPPDSLSSFKISYQYDQKFKSKITNIGQGTTTDMLLSAISSQMGLLSSDIILSKLAGFADFAEGEDLDQLYALLNIKRNPTTGATGFITVYRYGSGGNLTILAGSTFSTSATTLVSAIVFEVSADGIIPDGFSEARIPIKASQGYKGTNSNIAPNRIVNVLNASGIVRVNNPFKYVDYEFIPVIDGKYVYFLEFPPERTINSQAYPPAITDKGLYSIMYWSDKTINDTNWSVGSGTMSIIEGSPINGTTKIEVTAVGYISITGLTIPRKAGTITQQGYDQVYIYIRGPSGESFGITIIDGIVTDSIVSLYKFNDAPADSKVVETEFKLFHGNHGLGDKNVSNQEFDGESIINTGTFNSGDATFQADGVVVDDILIIVNGTNVGSYAVVSVTNENTIEVAPDFIFGNTNGTYTVERQSDITEIKIDLNTIGDYYIDFIGIGTFLTQVSSADLDTPDEITISYTSSRLSVYHSPIINDFFSTYDGDASDSHSDELFIFYEWKNNIAGGANKETDENFRIRGKIASASFGKGTKNAIRSALLDIDSIKEAIIQDFDDDPSISPGDIYVYIYAEGFKLSSSLQAQILQAVDENRAAGIRASIYLPEVRFINFTINIVYDDTTGEYVGATGILALKNIISSAIDDYFSDQIGINDNLYFSDLIGFILDEIEVIIGGYVTHTISTEPTYMDDDIDGNYQYNLPESVAYDDPLRMSGSKAGVSIIIQRGNFPLSNIVLIGKTSQ